VRFNSLLLKTQGVYAFLSVFCATLVAIDVVMGLVNDLNPLETDGWTEGRTDGRE